MHRADDGKDALRILMGIADKDIRGVSPIWDGFFHEDFFSLGFVFQIISCFMGFVKGGACLAFLPIFTKNIDFCAELIYNEFGKIFFGGYYE